MPPCGSYNLNYDSVHRKYRPLAWTHQENRSKIIKEKVEPALRLIEMPRESKGFLDYKRKIARPDFFKLQGTTPHDKRFEPFDYFPKTSSKSK